jgi:hypothetical protein
MIDGPSGAPTRKGCPMDNWWLYYSPFPQPVREWLWLIVQQIW